MNYDGKSGHQDVMATINNIAGSIVFERADVNGDNDVDISDIEVIISITTSSCISH